MLTVRTKKKTLQMYLMKRSVCGLQRRLGDFLPQVLADRLDHVRPAGRHERVDVALAAAAPDHHRDERDQQHAGQRQHRNLIGKDRDDAVRRQRPEVGRALDERMLDDVRERAFRMSGRRLVTVSSGSVLRCVIGLHINPGGPEGPRYGSLRDRQLHFERQQDHIARRHPEQQRHPRDFAAERRREP